jgi:hypothetical protein
VSAYHFTDDLNEVLDKVLVAGGDQSADFPIWKRMT